MNIAIIQSIRSIVNGITAKRLSAAPALLLAIVGITAAVNAAEGGDCDARPCRTALAAARSATAKYHDVQTAIADGYAQVSPCVALPTGAAMGFHFAKLALVDLNVSERAPEVLLYAPGEEGSLELVGLEYLVPFTGSNPAPSLFGRLFEGPNPNPFPSYSLHVWAWRHNPEGVFADFNPDVRCSVQ